MADVLEETTSRDIDRDHIVRRVDDWTGRIDALYKQVREWLPQDWSAEHRGTVQMREPLMQKFDVPLRHLPVLQLSYRGVPSARIEPRGLWIIGANGRLDFFSGTNHYVIVDTAENLQPPRWQIAPFSDRQDARPLTPETLRVVL